MDIENKNRVSVEDMRTCYAERFPYAPNNQRIGRFAKQIGFRLTKQMVKGQIIGTLPLQVTDCHFQLAENEPLCHGQRNY